MFLGGQHETLPFPAREPAVKDSNREIQPPKVSQSATLIRRLTCEKHRPRVRQPAGEAAKRDLRRALTSIGSSAHMHVCTQCLCAPRCPRGTPLLRRFQDDDSPLYRAPSPLTRGGGGPFGKHTHQAFCTQMPLRSHRTLAIIPRVASTLSSPSMEGGCRPARRSPPIMFTPSRCAKHAGFPSPVISPRNLTLLPSARAVSQVRFRIASRASGQKPLLEGKGRKKKVMLDLSVVHGQVLRAVSTGS